MELTTKHHMNLMKQHLKNTPKNAAKSLIVFKTISHESQWKNIGSSGNTHSVAMAIHWSWSFWQPLTVLSFSSSPGLIRFLYLILSFCQILQNVRFIWNQLYWNTFLSSNGSWWLFNFFNTLNLYYLLVLMTPGFTRVSGWCYHPETTCQRN